MPGAAFRIVPDTEAPTEKEVSVGMTNRVPAQQAAAVPDMGCQERQQSQTGSE